MDVDCVITIAFLPNFSIVECYGPDAGNLVLNNEFPLSVSDSSVSMRWWSKLGQTTTFWFWYAEAMAQSKYFIGISNEFSIFIVNFIIS
jgi:hypothetical protein